MKKLRCLTSCRDQVVEELATILRTDAWFEFKPLFLLIQENLRGRKALRTGEEMLRLRVYEKLHDLVRHGFAEKNGGSFRGIPDQLLALREYIGARQFLHQVQRRPEAPPVAV